MHGLMRQPLQLSGTRLWRLRGLCLKTQRSWPQLKSSRRLFFFLFLMGNKQTKQIKWPLLYQYIYTEMLPKNRWLNPKRLINLSGGQMVTQAKSFLCELHPWNHRKNVLCVINYLSRNHRKSQASKNLGFTNQSLQIFLNVLMPTTHIGQQHVLADWRHS